MKYEIEVWELFEKNQVQFDDLELRINPRVSALNNNNRFVSRVQVNN